MSIADKITQLTTIRASMREKLVAKGVTEASSHDFSNFPADIEAIPSGGGTDGQFFPMGTLELMPTITVTYNGNEV